MTTPSFAELAMQLESVAKQVKQRLGGPLALEGSNLVRTVTLLMDSYPEESFDIDLSVSIVAGKTPDAEWKIWSMNDDVAKQKYEGSTLGEAMAKLIRQREGSDLAHVEAAHADLEPAG